jgi:hypothetical protein
VFQQGSNAMLGLGLCAWRDGSAREAVALAAELGYRAVQLDATHPQTRPRSLDRSARRDLAALLRRHQLRCTGFDLWLPPAHLAEGPNVERATEAIVDAIGLARELTALVETRAIVSVVLPVEPNPEAITVIEAAARRHEVAVADYAWPARETGDLGLDPSLAIMANQSAPKAATQFGDRLVTARLRDAGVSGHVPVGSAGGTLDVPAYAAALSISAPNVTVVADVRSLRDATGAAASALRAWTDATEPFGMQEHES